MNNKKRKVDLMSAMLIFVLLVSLVLPCNEMRVSAAVSNSRIVRGTGYVRHEIPEVREIGPVPLDASVPQALNSTNLNYNVSVGRHYAYLDPTEKILYRAILVAARHVYMSYEDPATYDEMACVAKLMPSLFTYENQQLWNAQDAAVFDHPELTQLTVATLYRYNVTVINPSTNEEMYSTHFMLQNKTYEFTRAQYDTMTSDVERARSTILSNNTVKNADSLPEKELAIHDLLCAMNDYSSDPDRTQAHNICHSAYSALVNDGYDPVCDGYSGAFQYLLDGAGIDSYIVVGNVIDSRGKELHAWNIVKIGGQWYEVDTTWDPKDADGDVTHDFFNLTTQEISTKDVNSRTRINNATKLPIATGTKYSYDNFATWGDDIAVTGLTWDQRSLTLYVGVDGTFTAKTVPEDATSASIKWSSSDESVLAVSNGGHYLPLSPGRCTVTASVKVGGNTASSSCDITVVANPAYIHTVSFDTNGGTGTASPIQVTEGEPYGVLPTGITKDDCTFDGWYTELTGGARVAENTIYLAKTDKTLYAHWIEKKFSQNDVNFEVDDAANATVKKGTSKKIKKLTIGDTIEYNGIVYTVTEIAKGAFKGYKKLTSVKLGRNIKKIGAKAFYGCSNVKKFTIYGNNLKTVGSGSFKGLKKGVKIKIVCKDKKTYKKIVKKLEKAGAKDAKFSYKKGK